MNVMSELHDSLRSMGFVQLLLTQVFLASYALAISGFTGLRSRGRAGLAALLSAAAFVVLSGHWEHGALFVVLAVGGLGLFVASVTLLSALLGVGRAKAPPAPALDEDLPVTTRAGTDVMADAAAPRLARLRRKRAAA